MAEVFETRKLPLAAYLKYQGHDYFASLDHQGVVVFRFTTTSREDTLAYNDGGMVEAKRYYQELKTARGWVYWLTRDGR